MVSAIIKNTKVVLKLAKGSQTISNCKKDATDEQLFALGRAVASLEAEELDSMTKVVESTLDGDLS